MAPPRSRRIVSSIAFELSSTYLSSPTSVQARREVIQVRRSSFRCFLSTFRFSCVGISVFLFICLCVCVCVYICAFGGWCLYVCVDDVCGGRRFFVRYVRCPLSTPLPIKLRGSKIFRQLSWKTSMWNPRIRCVVYPPFLFFFHGFFSFLFFRFPWTISPSLCVRVVGWRSYVCSFFPSQTSPMIFTFPPPVCIDDSIVYIVCYL